MEGRTKRRVYGFEIVRTLNIRGSVTVESQRSSLALHIL